MSFTPLSKNTVQVSPASLYSEFVAVDIETTGLSPADNKIIEIGAVRMVDGNMAEQFRSFINPGVPIPYFITKMTGISDDMVKDAPPIGTVLPEFLRFAGASPLVAHNASFDLGFLNHNAHSLGLRIDNPVVCTLQLCRKLFRELENHKLDTVTRHVGINLEQHHRAMADCIAAAQIYLKCLERMKNGKG